MELSEHFNVPNITLARIQESDSDETVALINSAYEYQNKVTGTPRINAQKLQARAQKSDFYVLKEKDVIIGCVYIEPNESAVHLGLLTLATSHRGTGLASALIWSIVELGRKYKFTSLELDYMSIAPWLKRYYEKYGFKETGEVEPWGAIDLIRMKKALTD